MNSKKNTMQKPITAGVNAVTAMRDAVTCTSPVGGRCEVTALRGASPEVDSSPTFVRFDDYLDWCKKAKAGLIVIDRVEVKQSGYLVHWRSEPQKELF